MEVELARQSSTTPSSEDVDPENVASQLQGSSDSGDYEEPPVVAPKSRQRQHRTVSSVTADTRRILEQFLMRGTLLGSSKRNSQIEHQYAVVGDLPDEDPQPTPYQQIGSDDDCFSDFYQNFSKSDGMRYINAEPDYVDCQMLVKELMNSEAHRKSSHHRSQKKINSPPGNVKFAIGHTKPKGKTKAKAGGQEEINDGSSSSTEDYEFPDNELLNRKKKSSFRLALERVRQSFRRQGKKTPEVPQENSKLTVTLSGEQRKEFPGKSEVPLPPTPVAWNLGKPHCKLRREGSETSKTQATASGTPSEIDFGHGKAGTAEANVLQVPHTALPCDEKKKKSPALWRKSDAKEKGNEEKVRENRGIFEVILRQFRKGSSKLKRKGGAQVGKQIFHSADNLSIHPPTEEEKKLVEQFVLTKARDIDYDSDFAAARCRVDRDSFAQSDRLCSAKTGVPPRHGHHSFREKMRLDDLVVCRPHMPLPFEADLREAQKASLPVPASSSESGSLGAAVDRETVEDSVDFCAEIERVLCCASSKPFSQKSEREKDELFEKIAEQLALIADHYNLDSPSSPPFLYAASQSKENAEETLDNPQNFEIKKEEAVTLDSLVPHQLSQLNRVHSTSSFSGSPAVAQLVKTPTYGTFKQIVGDSVGAETSWQQIAKLFRLTQSAIHLAGMGTSVAGVIKDMTIRYFEDRFASWIVGQGGWESMVEDTNTELDSELD